ncbi:uncharacterized protein LOC126183875 isoform X1 [Schistocerca cancellata]|uniref:uncharacterized protein LOC126183875 isoform X1 n=2 Tax=Schistocerca cancellata TaxID=274614 RepID=UPI0021186A85|nr:uncharacterized protein LOC126183875 isoform X1 [Schistocerca cancellata]
MPFELQLVDIYSYRQTTSVCKKSISPGVEWQTRMHVCWRRLMVAMVALPVAAGVVIILVCFVSCPLLWAKLPKSEASDYYRVPLYVVSALALWVLLAIGVFFLWWRRQPKAIADEPSPLAATEA